jgi:hypothetical protein
MLKKREVEAMGDFAGCLLFYIIFVLFIKD